MNEEQGILDTLEEKLREYTNGGSSNPTTPGEPETPPTTPTVDSKGLAKENTTIKPDKNSNLQIVIPAGFAPAILQTGTTQSLPGQDGSVKQIMPANEWNNITAEQINKGIVVVDHAITYDGGNTTGTVPDFNEFVWVPMPDSSKFVRTAWTIGTSTTPHPLTEESTADDRFWEDKTTSEYTNMVSSVKQHKGFYIGRYEASEDTTGTIAQSKRNQATWTEVSQTASITASSKLNSSNNSHLMYGIEWDSVLNWLQGNATISSSTADQTKTMELPDIQTNSCSWGNYYNSTGDAATNSGSKQNTGKSEYWKANNIYDLAGNVREWTQEKYSTLRVHRGSCHDGYDYPAAYRSYYPESAIDYDLRFSYQLFHCTDFW